MRGRLARRAGLLSGLVAVFTLVPTSLARAGTDVFQNIGPASPLPSGGAVGRYPWDNYALDIHFSAISASLTGGVDVSGLLPTIAWFFASIFWIATSFIARFVVELFAFAFNLDLVNGSEATGGAGALAPVASAIHSIYANVFGAPWLVLAISLVGMWALWRALVQRRYAETAGALALSLIYVVIALFFVAEPALAIGQTSRWTNEMSQAFLSVSNYGDPSGGQAATDADAEELWGLLAMKPWSVLEFGGLEHCAVSGTGDEDSDPDSAPVRPLSESPARDGELARRLQSGTEVTADGKVCVNNLNKYGRHFLRFGFGTDERNAEYDALNHGDSGKLPEADDEKAGYRLGVADKPATDAMEEGGQYQRLLLSIVVFLGELGAFILLGSLSLGVILSQVLLLLLLAFAPVALVAAVIPGRGHDFFVGWLKKLAGYLLRKAAYSLVLAILLAVNGAIADATASLGWLFAFGLQAAFFWAVLIQRRTLTDGIVGIATGSKAPGGEIAFGALALYGGARVGSRAARRRIGRFAGSDRGERHARRRPSFGGVRYSAPVGGGAPPMDSPGPAEDTTTSKGTERDAAPGTTPPETDVGTSAPKGESSAAPPDRRDAPSRPSSSQAPVGDRVDEAPPRPDAQGKTTGETGSSPASESMSGAPGSQEAGSAGSETPRSGGSRRRSRPASAPADSSEGEAPERAARPTKPARPARSGAGDRVDSGSSSAPPAGSELSDELRAERERAKPEPSDHGAEGVDAQPAPSAPPPADPGPGTDEAPEPVSPPRRRRPRLRRPSRWQK